MLGVDAQDPGELRQRTRQIQLVTGPGDMTVTEILQIVVDARSQRHSAAAGGDDLVVLRGAELTHIQAVVGQAPVHRHDELRGSVPEQPLQQLHHCSALRLVAGFRFDVVQCGKLTAGGYKETQHDDKKQAAVAPG